MQAAEDPAPFGESRDRLRCRPCPWSGVACGHVGSALAWCVGSASSLSAHDVQERANYAVWQSEHCFLPEVRECTPFVYVHDVHGTFITEQTPYGKHVHVHVCVMCVGKCLLS